MDKLFLVVLASLLVAASCYPPRIQRESSEEKDVEMVPEKETFARVPLTRVAVPFGFNYRHQFPFSDSDDFSHFGAPAPWPPMHTPHFGDFPAMPMGGSFQNPFQSMFSEMEAMLREMKKEMDEIASRAGTGTTVQISGNEFDPSKMRNKTISKTEVVNGVVVQTNETTYTSGDAKNGSFFKVKVIEFRPKDESSFGPAENPNSENPKYPQEKPRRPDVEMLSPSTTTKSSVDSGKREELDSENENEIPNPKNGRLEIENIKSGVSANQYSPYEVFDNGPIEIDLTRDTAVNDYVFNQEKISGLVRMDPDSEFIDTNDGNRINSMMGRIQMLCLSALFVYNVRN